jgi:hypothetical protein
MKLTRFALPLAFAGVLSCAGLAAAATVQPGDLIKGSSSAVYYYGQDGKRYDFPNEKTYATWYADFSTVKTVTDADLASFPLGANVTYRPGVRMLKIQTDPKVYAIAHNGTLRWVSTESVARDLYGADWNTKIDDISDAFFVNYHVGTPIMSATDFSPSAEMAASPSIGVDKGLNLAQPTPTSTPSAPGAPTSTHYGTLTSSNPSPTQNQLVTLTASATPSSGLWHVNVFFDGLLTRTCDYSPCGADVRTPTGRTSVDATAEFVWTDGSHYITTTTLMLTQGAPGTSIMVTNPEVRPGDLQEIVVGVDSSFTAKTIDIFVDGSDIRGCNDVQQCRYTGYEASPVGTTHTAYGIIRDANGFSLQTAFASWAVVSNPHPVLSILTGNSDINAGESVDATVNASDSDGIAWTEISTDDGQMTKRCYTSSCTLTVTPSTARTFHFIASAADMTGLVGYATSTAVTVH